MSKESKERRRVLSLLAGTDELTDAFLNLDRLPLTTKEKKSQPHWHGGGVCIKFAQSNAQFKNEIHVYCLLRALMIQIEHKWHSTQSGRRGRPSSKNWQWSPKKKIQKANNSPEVKLERAIAQATLEKAQSDPEKAEWSNHIPICASYLSDHADGQTCIDVARRHRDGEYTFFELKWESNNPLYAAMQLLRYFTVYLFTRCHLVELGYSNCTQSMLEAQKIHLGVLAPPPFYGYKIRGCQEAQLYELGWFEQSVDAAVQKFVRECTPQELCLRDVSFAFYKLPEPPGTPRETIDTIAKTIVTDPSCIKRVYN
jgi:hypothetical protein